MHGRFSGGRIKVFLESTIGKMNKTFSNLFLSDLLLGNLIAEIPGYLTGVGLYDAITVMSSIFTFET